MSAIQDNTPNSSVSSNQDLINFLQEISCLRIREELLAALKDWLGRTMAVKEVNISLLNHKAGESSNFISSLPGVTDSLIENIVKDGQPVILSTATEVLNGWLALGIKEVFAIPMKNGEDAIGVLFLMTDKTDAFTDERRRLGKSLSSQLSIMIANIIANDIILEKEQEVSFLLAFSNEIATVRNRKQLSDLINHYVRKLVPFKDFAIVLHDPEQDISYHFLSSLPNESPGFLSGEKLSNGFKDYKTIITGNSDQEGSVVCIPISNGEQLAGALYLLEQPDNFIFRQDANLLKGIADQLSFTILNVLANEMVIKQEAGKTILLDLSKEMAKVRSKSDLLRLISDKFERLLPNDDCLILKLDQLEQSATVFLRTQSSLKDDSRGIAINDLFHQTALAAGKPVVFGLAELCERDDAPAYIRSNYAQGVKTVVATVFSDGKLNTGLLMFFTKERNPVNFNRPDLVSGFASQLPAAISNISANEKIEQQIAEIFNYKQQLEVENHYLQEEIQTENNYSEIIGKSNAMRNVFDLISQVSATPSTVLLLGETGTGKELIARAIHNNSSRKGKVMVKVNCATLPANLIESELFGHERGSFTGATDKRIGKFELANHSTIFLDEIGELPPDLQVKLLRALQEQEIERVGGRNVLKIDVRVIAATNRDLEKEILAGNFRSDLFFRLNVFPILVPPLRERKEDIPILSMHFLEKYAKRSNKKITGFSTNSTRELLNYNWPGNVRELEHLIERNILLTAGSTISQMNLMNGKPDTKTSHADHGIFKTIDEIEREHIMAVLRTCNGKVGGSGGAAEILKLPATTIHSKMKRLGISKKYSAK